MAQVAFATADCKRYEFTVSTTTGIAQADKVLETSNTMTNSSIENPAMARRFVTLLESIICFMRFAALLVAHTYARIKYNHMIMKAFR